jgi:molecular chaperone DnaJ
MARAASPEERSLSVNIPAGIEDGTRIRLAGEGEAGLRGGPGGRSLHLPVGEAARILPARRRRPVLHGADLDDDGRPGRLVRGATLDGTKSRVKVPEGTQNGKQFRLKGKGMPVLRRRRSGDLYIQIQSRRRRS